MGSPYVLAHGWGTPVQDATTFVTLPDPGEYRVWVRTRDWVAQWGAPGTPGRFQIVINGKPLAPVFGTEGREWHWQDGGRVQMTGRHARLALKDLTGFEGRCDAVYFTSDLDFRPPDGGEELDLFRRKALGLPQNPPEAGPFDFVVVGGGVAGISAAISAARSGLNVALIQNRPVLGGNNSSEIGVPMGGEVHSEPFPALGSVTSQVGRKTNSAWRTKLEADDEGRLALVSQAGVRVFLNSHVVRVELKDNGEISSVIAVDIRKGSERKFSAPLFADCTGDGNLGFLAGADFRTGRESREQTGETMAAEEADNLVMGATLAWYSQNTDGPVDFPDCPWAVQFTEETHWWATRVNWDWETGFRRDMARDTEHIRDQMFRAVLGNWAFMKNKSRRRAEITNRKLNYVAHIIGKRESRRLLGDHILTQQDILNPTIYPDACVPATWGIDLHVPDPRHTEIFPGEEFKGVMFHPNRENKEPYPIPYRCLYSRNVNNLFMAGRNISVTHVALGQVRVQATTGMMGEVIGMAATLCRREEAGPREIYLRHLPRLLEAVRQGVPEPEVGAPVQITSSYPGGNVVLVGMKGDTVYVRPALRDNMLWWFYWNFRVIGAAGRKLRFEFVDGDCPGEYLTEPTLSSDGGQSWSVLGPQVRKNTKMLHELGLAGDTIKLSTKPPFDLLGPAVKPKPDSPWSWLGKDSINGRSFQYTFPEDATEVFFSFTIPYQQAQLDQFLEKYAHHSHLSVEELCKTRKQRSVEMLRLGRIDGCAKERVVITCRHHACEMSASYCLEGILEAMLADTEDARWFQENVEALVIPFVDKDGVEDGDQGKGRRPRDHNRDYDGEPLFESTRAIRRLLPEWAKEGLAMVIDIHDPSMAESKIYQVGKEPHLIWREQQSFGRILEKVQTGKLRYNSADDMPFGKGWNQSSNYIGGISFGSWASRFFPQIRFVTSLEFPYAQVGEEPVTPETARAFGHDLARAIRLYLSQPAR